LLVKTTQWLLSKPSAKIQILYQQWSSDRKSVKVNPCVLT
jgi:hypothetical protein